MGVVTMASEQASAIWLLPAFGIQTNGAVHSSSTQLVVVGAIVAIVGAFGLYRWRTVARYTQHRIGKPVPARSGEQPGLTERVLVIVVSTGFLVGGILFVITGLVRA
jgi:hypothetical protein